MSSLLRLEREQKDSHITPSYLFIWNENDKYVYALQYSLEKHSLIQTKIGKSLPVFRPKRRKNHTHWGGTFVTYKANVREYSPPEARGPKIQKSYTVMEWADCVFSC